MMTYVEWIDFPDRDQEQEFFMAETRTCFDTFYPFQVLSAREFTRIDFEPVTILYGGNGSGKTTALNILAEKLGLKREAAFNRSSFLGTYLSMCQVKAGEIPPHSRIIASDDVFDHMLDVRSVNNGVDQHREQLFTEYLDEKYTNFRMASLDDFEALKKSNDAKRKTQSRFVQSRRRMNVREYSNGESALRHFTERIREGGLYLLDEPENSLSPERQLELKEWLEDLVRYDQCQLVLSTHSPFLLALEGAKIYDLDESPVDVKPWTKLGHVRAYHDFFKKYHDVLEE